MNIDIKQIEQELKQTLSEKRYIHSLGVMERAEELAKIYGMDEDQAKIVGLLHDIAKEFTKEEALKKKIRQKRRIRGCLIVLNALLLCYFSYLMVDTIV